jgi:hypothetical protein
MPETTQLAENVKKLMFIYSLNMGELRKVFGTKVFDIIKDNKHPRYKYTAKKLAEYFNMSVETLLYKEIINTTLNRRYFL